MIKHNYYSMTEAGRAVMGQNVQMVLKLEFQLHE